MYLYSFDSICEWPKPLKVQEQCLFLCCILASRENAEKSTNLHVMQAPTFALSKSQRAKWNGKLETEAKEKKKSNISAQVNQLFYFFKFDALYAPNIIQYTSLKSCVFFYNLCIQCLHV